MNMKKPKPTRPVINPALAARLEKLRGHKTLTGLINDVLTDWANEMEPRKAKRR